MELKAGVYKHYKGAHYMVLGIAEHTEREGEWLVIYVSLEGAHLPGPRMRARPVTGTDGWFTPVVIDGVSEPRFRYVGTVIGT